MLGLNITFKLFQGLKYYAYLVITTWIFYAQHHLQLSEQI